MYKQYRVLKKWMRSRRNILFVCFFSITFVGTIIYLVAHKSNWIKKEYKRQEEYIKQRDAFEKLNLYIKTGEALNRGYALSGDNRFKKDTEPAIDSIHSVFRQIQSFKNENPIIGLNKGQLVKLDTLIERKISFMRRVMNFGADKPREAGLLLSSGEGMRLADSIAATCRTLTAGYNSNLEKSKIQFWEVKRIENIIIYSSLFVLIVFIILSVMGLVKQKEKRKILHTELVNQKELFEIILSNLGEGLITTDKYGGIIYMNAEAQRLTGWKSHEALYQPLEKVYNVTNEETGQVLENIVSRILLEGRTIETENNTILNTKDFDKHIITNSGSPLFDINGNISGSVLVFNDVTEKKKIEGKLYEREKQYRDLIQNLTVAIYTCDQFGYIQLYNNAAVSLWGREPVAGKEQWCGSWKIFDTNGNDLPIDSCPMAITLKESRPVHGEQIIIQRPDGSYRHVLPYPTPLFDANGKLTGAVNMLLDVTDKKEKEILIRQTEEKYRNLIEQASDGVLVYSYDGTIYEFNKVAHQQSGYTREEFEKLKLTDVLFDGKIVGDPDRFEKISKGETVLFEKTIKRKDRTSFEVEINARMMPDGHVLAFIRDITKRKEAEQQIKESEERYRNMVERNPAGIFQTTIDGTILSCNNAFATMLGYASPKELQQINTSLLYFSNNNRNHFITRLQKNGELNNQELKLKHKDGHPVYIIENCSIRKDIITGLELIEGTVIDITDHKEAEEQLAESEKNIRHVLSSTSESFYVIDRKCYVTLINKNASANLEKAWGKPVNLGTNILPLIPNEDDEPVRGSLVKVFAGEPVEYELRLFIKNLPAWVQVNYLPVKDDGGVVVGAYIATKDISEKRLAEEKLRLSEARLNQAQAVARIGSWETDLQTLEVIWSEETFRIFGISPKDFKPTHEGFLQLLHPDDVLRVNTAFQNSTEIDKAYSIEHRVVLANQNDRIVEECWQVFNNDQGVPIRVVGTCQDITERKITEEAIRESNERYELVTKATNDMVWDWNVVTGEVYRSKEGWKKIFKSDLDNSNGNEESWQSKIHPEDKERVERVRQELINSVDKDFFEIECRVIREDGSYAYIHDKGYILRNNENNPVRIIGASSDITQRKLADDELKKLSLVAKETNNVVIITDTDEKIQWVNEAFTRITGYEPGEAIGKRPGTFLQGPETNPVVVRYMRRKIRNRQPFECDIINYSKSGSKHWVRIQCQPEFDATGNLFSFFSIQTEITKEKEAEEALKASEERYRYLFNNNPASIYLWDLDTLQILKTNNTAVQQYGYSHEEFNQLTILDLRSPDEYNRIKEFVEEVKANPDTITGSTWKHINKAGEVMYMNIASHKIEYEGKTVMIAMAKNISEKFLLQEKLEKERTLKEHEIKNAVLSAQEKERQEIGRELHDNINQILASSRLYLAMAKTEVKNKVAMLEESDNLINTAIAEIRSLSHSLISPSLNASDLIGALEQIMITVKETTGLTTIDDFASFDEDKIPDKCKLAIYRIVQEQYNNINKYALAKKVQLKLQQQNDKLILSIKDDGIGFDTSKKVSGVGLLNISSRASLFNGEVNIISSPGNGCEVLVTIPLENIEDI